MLNPQDAHADGVGCGPADLHLPLTHSVEIPQLIVDVSAPAREA